jgi:hypothetical protein
VKKFKSTGDKHYSLTSDGWTDPNDNPRRTYCQLVNGKTLYLESINTGEVRHTGQLMAVDAKRVIDKELLDRPVSISCGMVTDNTSANKVMWSILSLLFLDQYFYGCAAHSGHLIIQKIFSPTKKNGSYGNVNNLQYPFEELMEFTKGSY